MNISSKTIDESKNMLTIISSANHSLDMAIEIMYRYQKIQEIVSDGYLQDKSSGEILLEIKRVINDVDN